MSRRLGLAVIAAGLGLSLAACTSAPPPSSPSPTPLATSVEPTPASAPAEPTPPETAVSGGSEFYNAGGSAATAYAQLVEQGRDADAALIKRIADQPVATWLGDWQSADAAGDTAKGVTAAAGQAGQVAVFVLYAIPGRDCGLHSAGGVPEDRYLEFAGAVAEGIAAGDGQAWVVLEPDALAQWGDCEGQGDRLGLLAGAAEVLDDAGASVFLDAGHSDWHSAQEIAQRLERVGTAHLTGFSTNVSNYQTTADERAWAEDVAARTGLEFLVDTSRNGNGSDGQWCNPRGRALGEPPAVREVGPMVATVWVKAPGESDGQCNGGPAAGQWWMDVALELARNSG